jgi:cellobiose phosphorylase
MNIKNTLDLISINNENLRFRFLKSGDLYDMMTDHIQINLQKGNVLDGALSGIYLRQRKDFSYQKLIHPNTITSIQSFDKGMIYTGSVFNISFELILTVYPHGWTYDLNLISEETLDIDIFYGQDVGIQDINGILNNEAYIVQYIDYKVFQNDNGYTLCARQNQGQSFFLQMGMREKTVGFSTDAMQFFTPRQKNDGHIYALDHDRLENKIYQYESSYFVLQSDVITVSSSKQSFQFYGHIKPVHEASITNAYDVSFPPISISQLQDVPFVYHPLRDVPIISGKTMDNDQILTKYEDIHDLEYHHSFVSSFFLNNHTHVVSKEKDLDLERSHGHILLQGDILEANERVMGTTAYMSGIFLSHVAIGNTSFHKLIGDHRHPLMLHRMAGFRLYLLINETYHLLGLPSLFEIHPNHVSWIYAFNDDIITVTLHGKVDDTQVQLDFHSEKNITYTLYYTMSLLMGPSEMLYDLELKEHSSHYTIMTPEKSMAFEHYPTLQYHMKLHDTHTLNHTYAGFIEGTIHSSNIDPVLIIKGSYEPTTVNPISHVISLQSSHQFYHQCLNHLELKHQTIDMRSHMDVLIWYAQQALIHYASPHGLEQYNGAAWGTRDVCQGPFEFFSAIQDDVRLKHILKTVYGRQFYENGDFPQWFMYDKYAHIQAHEAHGDIIFWPLKALAYYLKQTGDLSILEEKVMYYSLAEHCFGYEETLYDHVKKQIQAILTHVIHHLPIYGGGDWDDTLQPASHILKETMVSGWTSALMYQVLDAFKEEIKVYDKKMYTMLSKEIKTLKASYETHLLPDAIPAGFAVFNGEPTYLLHPRDQETGLTYRLLPFTRSILANLTNETQNQSYLTIIKTHLLFPDGVRLMDQPVTYLGGLKHNFNRAETAANFGREIGLMYVHAHIRYIEALYHIGLYDDAYEAMLKIHPIKLIDTVKHALPRQRNTYFSSSDGCFIDRYQAKKDFHQLKTGIMPVKGGWRVYSSGPGIFIHQIIVNMLGIQRHHLKHIHTPHLPKHLKDLIISIK